MPEHEHCMKYGDCEHIVTDYMCETLQELQTVSTIDEAYRTALAGIYSIRLDNPVRIAYVQGHFLALELWSRIWQGRDITTGEKWPA